ncbi:MAG: hypothetical protein M1833_005074 [Piccolia ochrophora]|nr:MAG: hypothetical protein M1833_005074 [Piccolia ochrophora]
MAWRCSGETNEELVKNLRKASIITTDSVQEAMLGVDRADYAPERPYDDEPKPIGHAATISAPHMHAHACDSLRDYLKPGARVLDIGSGSGYLSHVLARLIRPNGAVVGIDHIQELVDMANKNVRKSADGRELLEEGTIKFNKADGRLGWPDEAPYDAIHVGAAATKGSEQTLIDQLKSPGSIFIPVKDGFQQNVWIITKDKNGSIERTKFLEVSYVPLTDAPRQ